MASITLENITKKFHPDVTALSHVEIAVADGEFMVLLGPSGCGKTTMLRIMAGLEPPDEGHVYMDGECVTEKKPQERNVAMVFQNYALYSHMTVYKNIAFPLQVKKLPRGEVDRRVMEAAKLLDIEHVLNRRPRALSGGQRQRVALGRAMVREPTVFLLDEPLSNLDTRMRGELRLEIMKLHRHLGATFVYVTHDQHEAMAMGDRVAVMNEGAIVQIGNPQQVYDEPETMFVAGFVGSPGMNFFPGVVRKDAGGFVLEHSTGSLPLLPERFSHELLIPHVDGTITCGIRPEDLKEDGHQLRHHAPLPVRVREVELMGGGTHVTCDMAGETITALFTNRTALRTGDEVSLVADCDRLHLFDGEGVSLRAKHAEPAAKKPGDAGAGE